MTIEYSAENHDWDLTFRSAWTLLGLAGSTQEFGCPPSKAEQSFACLSGSMMLSFASIESFSASVAFSMPKQDRWASFDFGKYRRAQRFWDKIEMIFEALDSPIDKSQGLFQCIAKMQDWRNLVAHSSPYEIEPTQLKQSGEAGALHRPFRHKEYTRRVTTEAAVEFYQAAFDYIDLLKGLAGIEPRAMAVYGVGEVGGEVV